MAIDSVKLLLTMSRIIKILNKLPSKLEYKNKMHFSTANTEKSTFYAKILIVMSIFLSYTLDVPCFVFKVVVKPS